MTCPLRKRGGNGCYSAGAPSGQIAPPGAIAARAPTNHFLEVIPFSPLVDLFSLPFECCSSFRSKGIDPSEFHRRYGRTDLCIAVMMDLGCTSF